MITYRRAILPKISGHCPVWWGANDSTVSGTSPFDVGWREYESPAVLEYPYVHYILLFLLCQDLIFHEIWSLMYYIAFGSRRSPRRVSESPDTKKFPDKRVLRNGPNSDIHEVEKVAAPFALALRPPSSRKKLSSIHISQHKSFHTISRDISRYSNGPTSLSLQWLPFS